MVMSGGYGRGASRMIIDTDVLVWASRGNAKAIAFIEGNRGFAVSAVTYMELMQGARDRQDLNAIRKALRMWRSKVLPINEEISQHAVFFVETYALSHSLFLADALLAATAIHHGETLTTCNAKHYQMIPDLECQEFRA